MDVVSTATSVALPAGLVRALWLEAEGEACGLECAEFAMVLERVAARLGLDEAGLRGLRLGELALAQACALGREVAWQRFMERFRGPMTQAAMAIGGSATVGYELADSLYGELFGLTLRDGERRSPLVSYMGRGSLLGWLRTTLAQRHVDRHRKTYREQPLEDVDAPAEVKAEAVAPEELRRLNRVVAKTLAGLGAEDRVMLTAYYLDGQTLAQIGRVLRVHEATVSRRMKRLVEDVRRGLLRNLEAGGLSRRAAEEALGVDPRDIEVNLRVVLQEAQVESFSGVGGRE